jgi:hypothetical protein
MIDIFGEELLTLSQAARSRPGSRNGRPTHPSTPYRWAVRGIRGHRLEVVRIGGTLYTSRQALQRFVERLNETPVVAKSVPIGRSHSSGSVDSTLDRLGL